MEEIRSNVKVFTEHNQLHWHNVNNAFTDEGSEKGVFHMQLEFHGTSFINIQNIYYMIISK